MSPEALVLALEALPLLGPGLAEARALEERCSRALAHDPDPALSLRVLIRRGERQLASAEEGASETLAEAARWAAGLQDWTTELRCRLLTARALAEAGSLADARALLRRAEAESAELAPLALDRALARASAGQHGVAEELERAREALEHAAASDPGLRARRAHDRLALAARLAEARASNRWNEAVRWSREGQAIAREHGDERALGRLEFQEGALLLRQGRRQEALPALARALDADDELVRLSAGLLLSGLHLDRGAPDAAEAVALPTLALAEARRNWLAFSSMAIDLARVAELRGGDPEAVLLDALARCRAQGEAGPLLQARLLELREPPPPDEAPE